ncbi:MAG: succinylglutamate desuccinylase/aspartoacylase family protein [Nitrosomonas sp.]|nr:succinylglutamate desuccinylase/aspartoacylase family protein [Nitrosomonas sp.]
MLSIRYEIPNDLLKLEANELYTKLDGPTLFHLPGHRSPPLFISVLLHGNEPVGWNAVRNLLQRHQHQTLPRALSLFVGNISAARHRVRQLDNQPDYNRIWNHGNTPEHAMAKQVVDEMSKKGLFASIDLHNNSGLNPHYACVNKLHTNFLHLATLFDQMVIYFTRPQGVQSLAFAELGPAVTIECGKPDNPQGNAHATEYLTACLHLADIPSKPLAKHDIQLFHTVAIVRLAPNVSVGFHENGLDLRLVDDIDHMNFRELPINTLLGWQQTDSDILLRISDEQDREVAERYFYLDGNALRTRQPVMPSMLTRNTQIIRQDCLCYLMERMVLSK